MLEPFVGSAYTIDGAPENRSYCEEDDPGGIDGSRATLY